MLTQNSYKKEFFSQFDSEKLAYIINHDIKSIPIDTMCIATHNYDVMFIESVMKNIKLQADIKRFAEIIKTCWKIDVARNRMEVVRLNTKTCIYEPYNLHFEDLIDAIVEKVRQTREWELSLKKQVEEWNRVQQEYSSCASTINESSESSQTTPPIFTTDESFLYHLDDLPKDVRDQILIDNDKIYSDFVTTMCGPIKGWIDKHRLQDWNVVRFICRLRGIVALKCSMAIFGMLLEKIGLGNQENNMKQRTDANDKNALIAYDGHEYNRHYYLLRKEGKEVEEILEDIIRAVAA